MSMKNFDTIRNRSREFTIVHVKMYRQTDRQTQRKTEGWIGGRMDGWTRQRGMQADR
jgi:hypothetical protein